MTFKGGMGVRNLGDMSGYGGKIGEGGMGGTGGGGGEEEGMKGRLSVSSAFREVAVAAVAFHRASIVMQSAWRGKVCARRQEDSPMHTFVQ